MQRQIRAFLSIEKEIHALRIPAAIAIALDAMQRLMNVGDEVHQKQQRLPPYRIVLR